MGEHRVLIVEDDPMVAAIHDRWVRAAGLHVAGTAASAEAALRTLETANAAIAIVTIAGRASGTMMRRKTRQ